MFRTNVYTATDDLEVATPSQDTLLGVAGGVVSWEEGDGDQRLLLASRSPITFEPFDNETYLPGQFVGDADVRAVFRGRGSSVDLNGVLDFTDVWYFRLFAFNGVASNEKYNRESLVIAGDSEGSFDYTLDDTFE